jgi:hypothetical protein
MATDYKNPWSVIEEKGSKYLISVYDSVDQMWLDAREPVAMRSRSSRDRGADWSGTDTFDEAFELGTRKGWLEGAQLATETRKKLGKIEAAMQGSRTFKFNTVVGGSVNIPRFVGGDKRHMTRRKRKRTGDGTHVTIGIECGMLGGVSAEACSQRGCALSALVRAIENTGISVELTALHTASTGGEWRSATTAVRVKRAGTYMNDERIAMALGNAASHRRGVFSIREMFPQFRQAFPGYGSTCNTPEFIRERLHVDYHIYNIHDDSFRWGRASDEEVVKWVRERFDEIVKQKRIHVA